MDNSHFTYGFVILSTGGPIAYKFQKYQSVALSSTKAKYIGYNLAGINIIWIQRLLKELKIEEILPKGAMVIYTNNQGAIKLRKNLTFQK